MPKVLYMIKDEHTEPAGREKAEEMVEKKQIDVFFMEWATPIDRKNIAGSFGGLNPADASPTLVELAQACVRNQIAVVACDLPVEETVRRLNAAKAAAADADADPDTDADAAPYDELSVFMPWGQAVRDRHAAQTIAAYLDRYSLVQSALLMFGAGHFDPKNEEYRDGTPPLNKLVQDALPDWVCCFLNC